MLKMHEPHRATREDAEKPPSALRRPGGRDDTVTPQPMRDRSEKLRTERLLDIQAQIADGTLVVRQMTAREREAAADATRSAQARTKERRELRRALAPGDR